MTHDLASRIADGRKKAEAVTNALIDTGVSWYDCETLREEETFDGVEAGYIAAIDPSLFIEMADEIDRLTAELEKAREALNRIARGRFDGLEVQHLSPYEVRRLAARVHAELTGEKEKEV